MMMMYSIMFFCTLTNTKRVQYDDDGDDYDDDVLGTLFST